MQKPYTSDESNEILRLLADGKTPREIATAINRTIPSVQGRIRTMFFTQADRKKRNELKAANKNIKSVRIFSAGNIDAARPSSFQIADRDRRYSRLFSIAIDLMGEPEPGRSALDRMQS